MTVRPSGLLTTCATARPSERCAGLSISPQAMSRPTGRPCRWDYPRLVALADKHNLWTDDATANAGLFGRGDGAVTMVLPNWIGRMTQFANDAGASVAPGLPNITGSGVRLDNLAWESQTGSFYAGAQTGLGWNELYTERGTILMFDASRSNPIYGRSDAVQPAAIKLLPILRY